MPISMTPSAKNLTVRALDVRRALRAAPGGGEDRDLLRPPARLGPQRDVHPDGEPAFGGCGQVDRNVLRQEGRLLGPGDAGRRQQGRRGGQPVSLVGRRGHREQAFHQLHRRPLDQRPERLAVGALRDPARPAGRAWTRPARPAAALPSSPRRSGGRSTPGTRAGPGRPRPASARRTARRGRGTGRSEPPSTHGSSGCARANARTASTTSATEEQSLIGAWPSSIPPHSGCTWPSPNDGSSAPPPRSTTVVPDPRSARAASSKPLIVPAVTATADAVGRAGSPVRTVPPVITRSAGMGGILTRRPTRRVPSTSVSPTGA